MTRPPAVTSCRSRARPTCPTRCCGRCPRRRSTTAGRSSPSSAARCCDALGPVFAHRRRRSWSTRAPGTGAWEAALVNTLCPGDRGAVPSRPGTSRTLWHRDGRTRSASRSTSSPATGATASTPPPSPSGSPPTPSTRSRPCASCTTRPRPASPAGSPRSARPSTPPATRRCCSSTPSRRWRSIDYRHDEWGVDVTVAGSQKGLMLPPGPGLQRGQREGARGVADGRAARVLLGLGADPRGQRARLLPLHARHQPALRAAGGAARCSTRRACRTSSPATSATPRRPAPPCAAGGWRCSAPTSASTPAR